MLISTLGFSRLPEAFGPLVSKDLKKNRAIEKIEYLPEGDGQVKLSWKEKFTDSKFKDQTYDYAVVSAPFSVVRRWRLPRKYKSQNFASWKQKSYMNRIRRLFSNFD